MAKKNKNEIIFFLLFIIALAITSKITSAANIITINNYVTSIDVEKNKINFEKQINLKNTGTNTIIPGELHFKLYEITDNDQKNIPKISELSATDKYNNDLSARILSRNGEAEVIVSAWQPILSQFEYNIILKYSVDFEAKGILFHNLNFPDEETTIPIRNSATKIILPEGYTVSYAPNATITKENNREIAEWRNIKEKNIEYTKLPFMRTNIHGATIFWVGLIILLSIPIIIVLILELIKKKS